MSCVVIPAVFDLAQTLDCGQAFLWQPEPGWALFGKDVGEMKPQARADKTAPIALSEREAAAGPPRAAPRRRWEGVAGGRYLRLEQTEDAILFYCSQEEYDGFWREYFDIDEDYAQKRAQLSAIGPVLAEAAAFAPGIRILRQDPWEALCSFLISQNNNIPRIRGILKTLCRLFGEPIPGTEEFAFPTAKRLSALSVEDLSPLRAGYRAKYLIDAARNVQSGGIDLKAIKNSPAEYGRAELQKVLGVGPKVAECVLLYGFHKMECFPMDVWMKRAMASLLPGCAPADFGENAGLAQQYLFHYARMHPELFTAAG